MLSLSDILNSNKLLLQFGGCRCDTAALHLSLLQVFQQLSSVYLYCSLSKNCPQSTFPAGSPTVILSSSPLQVLQQLSSIHLYYSLSKNYPQSISPAGSLTAALSHVYPCEKWRAAKDYNVHGFVSVDHVHLTSPICLEYHKPRHLTSGIQGLSTSVYLPRICLHDLVLEFPPELRCLLK